MATASTTMPVPPYHWVMLRQKRMPRGASSMGREHGRAGAGEPRDRFEQGVVERRERAGQHERARHRRSAAMTQVAPTATNVLGRLARSGSDVARHSPAPTAATIAAGEGERADLGAAGAGLDHRREADAQRRRTAGRRRSTWPARLGLRRDGAWRTGWGRPSAHGSAGRQASAPAGEGEVAEVEVEARARRPRSGRTAPTASGVELDDRAAAVAHQVGVLLVGQVVLGRSVAEVDVVDDAVTRPADPSCGRRSTR